MPQEGFLPLQLTGVSAGGGVTPGQGHGPGTNPDPGANCSPGAPPSSLAAAGADFADTLSPLE